MDNSPFGLEFGFELKRVQVWKFPNKDIKKEYHDLWGGDYEEGTTLEWIDSVRHISVDGTYKEIDYTEELGLLFKNLVLFGPDTPDTNVPRVTAFDVELLMIAKRRGYSIKEIPISWTYVPSTRVNPIRDSFMNFWDVLRVKFNDIWVNIIVIN